MTENRSLKNKVAELRGEIMTKSASISQTEGKIVSEALYNDSFLSMFFLPFFLIFPKVIFLNLRERMKAWKEN